MSAEALAVKKMVAQAIRYEADRQTGLAEEFLFLNGVSRSQPMHTLHVTVAQALNNIAAEVDPQ